MLHYGLQENLQAAAPQILGNFCWSEGVTARKYLLHQAYNSDL